MGRPRRSEQFHPSEIAIVHTVQRCVRRAFLAGVDPVSGNDYSFRREWIRRRLEALASVFGIDVLTYAVLSNHLHLILRSRPDVVAAWSDEDVAMRWLRVFPGRRLEEHLAEPNENDIKMLANQPERLAVIRLRLSDISWFMRALSEPIARMANCQDQCTGRFWEGRFKALRIVDEAGLLACSMYVDLNPVRAALAALPEQATHTSVYDRFEAEQGAMIESAAFDLIPITAEAASNQLKQTPVEALRQQRLAKRRHSTGCKIRRDAWLAPLQFDQHLAEQPQVHAEGLRASDRGFLHLNWQDYLELLHWTAKQAVREAVTMPPRLVESLTSLGLDATRWRDLVWDFEKFFGRSACAGSPAEMAADAERTGHHWHRGQKAVQACFVTA